VTSIGISAFNNCTSLTEIIIPASVTSISSSAFSNCSNLTIVTFETGSQLTSIGYSAFNNCTSLTEIIIPTSVTYLGNEIFSGCTTLTSVIFENTTGWFYTTASNATSGTDISVSDAAINAQNFQNIWKKYYLKRN